MHKTSVDNLCKLNMQHKSPLKDVLRVGLLCISCVGGFGDALMGLELDFYKSGNVCGAWLNNEKISNRESFRVGEAYSRAYIDLASGKVYECVGRYADDFMEKLNATFHA